MGVRHGLAVVDEMQRFVEAGLPLDAVLAAATGAPRRHFGGLPRSLAPGAAFEALLLDDTMTADLAALRTPRRIWTSAAADAAGEAR